MQTKFVINGTPIAKGRPRFSTNGKFPRAYTPQKTARYETRVRDDYIAQGGKYFGERPLKVYMVACFAPPTSVSKTKRAQMLDNNIRHTKKPDCDNLAKTILDALNGVAYKDDSQVTTLTVDKVYATAPRVTVTITAEGSSNND